MIRSFSNHPYALQNQVQGYLRYGKNIAKKAEINRDFTNSDHYRQRMIDKFVNEKVASVPDSGLYVLIRGFNGQKKITKSLEHANEGFLTSGDRETPQTEIQSFYSGRSGNHRASEKHSNRADEFPVPRAGQDERNRDNTGRTAIKKSYENGKSSGDKEWRFLALWENKSSSLFHREKLRMDQKKTKIATKS